MFVDECNESFADICCNIAVIRGVEPNDMNLDLATGKFWPFRKPNSETLYVNTKSNHPPNVIKEIPKSINKRILSLSCDSDTFNNAKPHYEQALRNSGHDF